MEKNLGQDIKDAIRRKRFLEDNADEFSQAVNSNLPEKFKVRMPILKGDEAWEFDVETFAKISGKEVALVLISPDAAALIEDAKSQTIEKELTAIAEIAPDIAIIDE